MLRLISAIFVVVIASVMVKDINLLFNTFFPSPTSALSIIGLDVDQNYFASNVGRLVLVSRISTIFAESPYVCIIMMVLTMVSISQTIRLFMNGLYAFWKFFLMAEVPNMLELYGGPGTWAVLTGPDGGQARLLAHGLAERGFNILLIGYKSCEKTKSECARINPTIEIRIIERNFCHAMSDPDFFDPIAEEFERIGDNLGMLLNCVGHRYF